MIEVTLKDGAKKYFEHPHTVADIAKTISEGLARVAVCAKVNGQLVDLSTVIARDCTLEIITLKDREGLDVYRHTTAHILAQAVKQIWPTCKLGIGPTIENGFYYDIDFTTPITQDNLAQIEEEMKKIIKSNFAIERFTLPRKEAIQLMQRYGENYKLELIQDLPIATEISFYKQGGFVDLCRGVHLPSTGGIKAFKLLSVTGAYWRGNENNKMLTRIYGTAFEKKEELIAYLEAVEEAKKRDHNKIGRELGIFMTDNNIGQGLPLFMPKGAKILQIMSRFVEDEEERRGYKLTKTPYMAKSDLYKISGHWQHYKDGMFVVGDEENERDEVMALRPMTCPFQYTIFNNGLKSYRDLPLRYNETSTLFRNENSGEMHGLIRLRQFTLSDGHLVVAPEQLEEEFAGVVDLVCYVLKTFGLEDDVKYRFSKWDPNAKNDKYIHDPETWNVAERTMEKILNHLKIDYTVGVGEAAFYGPKLDIQIKNVHGKEDTLITIQVDMFLAKNFDMTYINEQGVKTYPYIIHRSSIGCYERTLALLIEKYAGAFPLWLSPTQAIILPVSDKFLPYAQKVERAMRLLGLRVEVDKRNEKIGYKIREAQLEKIPYMLIVGEKEAESNTVSVRTRGQGVENESMALEQVIAKLRRENDEKIIF